MTRSQYAKHRGVSAPAVTQWAAKGRIVCDADGRVLVEESDRLLGETRDTRGGKHEPARARAPVVPSPAPTAADDGEQGDLDFDGTMVAANKRDRLAAARLKELEFAERAGQLVERSRHSQALLESLGPIVARLDAIPTQVSPKLIQLADVRRIEDILTDAIEVAKQEIANALKAFATKGSATTQ